jgi:hypothetical protein
MTSRKLFSLLALLALAEPALAQESGGLRLAPGVNGGPVGLARPLPFTPPPFLTAHDMQNGTTAADRQAKNQSMITRLRGDAGFLGGFSMGTPLAASRQPALPVLPDQFADGGFADGGFANGGTGRGHGHRHHGSPPVVINNQGPLALTVGNGNVVQQQSANGPGPIAQQQIATVPGLGSGGGAVNLVTGGGNILQRSPGGR